MIAPLQNVGHNVLVKASSPRQVLQHSWIMLATHFRLRSHALAE